MTTDEIQIQRADAYRLLAFCTRVTSTPDYDDALRKRASVFGAWSVLLELAEQHGMTPLLLHHLSRCKVSLAAETQAKLLGLVSRTQRQIRLLMQATAEILHAFRSACIPVLVLKGIALGTTVYPNPLLRPTTDLDLAVTPENERAAEDVLRQTGYQFSVEMPGLIWRRVDNFTISIDLQLLKREMPIGRYWSPVADEFIGIDEAWLSFDCLGEMGFTLGREAMLLYLSRHLARHLRTSSMQKPLRLIWIADLVNYLEKYTIALDWEMLQRHDRRVFGRMAVCQSFSDPQARLPDGLEHYYQGWPLAPISEWHKQGIRHFVSQSMFPSEWWLRLYYGSARKNTPRILLRLHHLANLIEAAIVLTKIKIRT